MKTDFKKTEKSYSATSGSFLIVTVPPLQYLMVDGRGAPDASAFAEAIEAIYPVAYKLKFISKRELDRDYVVMPLEAQWWSSDMAAFTSARDKSAWEWTVMSMVPQWMTRQHFDAAVTAVTAGGRGSGHPPPALNAVRLETLDEGLCVQTLHVGSFADEAGVLERMHGGFIPARGLRMTGRHHEIYFSDFRKVEPAKLRTLLRQPVAPGDAHA